MLADPTCPICIVWNDGDPACPKHGGTYEEGLVCPATKDPDHLAIRLPARRRLRLLHLRGRGRGRRTYHGFPIPGEGRRATLPAVGYPWRRRLT